jgi:hypothetical protein
VRATGLAAGSAHACALLTDGTVRCWGANYRGQLGDGTTTFRSVPVKVEGLSDAVAIVAGDRHTCALRREGTVWCWGANDLGQLGSADDAIDAHSSRPIAIARLADVKAMAAGQAHTLAVTNRGELYFWGGYSFGEPPSARVLTKVPLPEVARVAAGGTLACAWTRDRFQCWGPDTYLLGAGAGRFVLIGQDGLVPVHVAVSTGGLCAADTRGSVACWGEEKAPPSLAGVVSLSRRRHACAVLGDGKVACWGSDNAFGELGDGPERPPDLVGSVGASAAIEVAVGNSSTCIRTRDGRIECWGENGYGQLGDGTTESRRGAAEVRFCAESGEPIFPDPPPGEPLVAAMKRDLCMGSCPVYSVRVYADGTVLYRGEWHVRIRGGRKARLSPAALEALRAAFQRAAFLSLPYECGRFHTDDARVSVFFAEGEKSRLIEHNHGCEGAPPALTALEDAIDRIVGTEPWVGHVVDGPTDVGAAEGPLRVEATGARVRRPE